MRIKSVLFAALLTAPLAAAQLPELTLEQRLDHLEEIFQAARVEHHVAGLGLAVVQNDKVVFSQGMGMANLETERAATPDTIFAIGSTTKAFTATLIAMLVEEGKMGWDDPITKWLPAYQLEVLSDDADAVVTLRDVLSHRTGYTRQSILFASGKVAPARIFATAAHGKPYSPFRKKFHYNNVQFLAAGEASAIAAGMPWSELLHKRILVPLGMEHTTIDYESLLKNPKLATGYDWKREKGVFEPLELRDIRNIAPAGAIHSDIQDMAQWVRFQLAQGEIDGQRLVSAEILAETGKPNISMGVGSAYGMGWMLQEWNGHQIAQHGGNIDGFSTALGLMPDQDLGFILLTNANGTALQELCMPMVWETMVGDWRSETQDGAADDFGPLLGEYLSDIGNLKGKVLTVLEKDGKLAVDVPGQMVFELKSPDENGLRAFALTDAIQVEFETDDHGKATALVLHQGGLEIVATRKGSPVTGKLPAAELRPLFGRFHFEEIDVDCEVRAEDGVLILDIPQQGAFGMFPPDEEGKRRFRSLRQRQVLFERSDTGQVTGLILYTPEQEFHMARVAGAEVEALPTVEQVIALMEPAKRLAAVPQQGCLRITGHVLVEQSGVEGRFTAWVVPNQRHSFLVDFGDFGSLKAVVDGDHGWTDSDFGPFQEMTEAERQVAWESLPCVTALPVHDHGGVIEVIGPGEREGRKVWQMSHKVSGDRPATEFDVDAKTGDVVYMRNFSPVLGGLAWLPTEAHFEDFHEYHGVRVPHRIITTTDQGGRNITVVDSIDTRLEPAANAFERR